MEIPRPSLWTDCPVATCLQPICGASSSTICWISCDCLGCVEYRVATTADCIANNSSSVQGALSMYLGWISNRGGRRWNADPGYNRNVVVWMSQCICECLAFHESSPHAVHVCSAISECYVSLCNHIGISQRNKHSTDSERWEQSV